MTTLRIDAFRLPKGFIEAGARSHEERHVKPKAQSQGPPRPKDGELFLVGPVPLGWFKRAFQLPRKGNPPGVGFVTWTYAGIEKSASISLSNSRMAKAGLSRFDKYRGLAALELAGLVRVTRTRGRAPIVTLLAAEPVWNQTTRRSADSNPNSKGST
jgi:hypothetical protein